MSDLATALAFWPAAAIMLVTALHVFRTSSMARAGLLLLAALGIEGIVFLALASQFLGALQLLMMTAEMVIMTFFMVMFMADPGGLMGMDMTHDKRRSGVIAAALGAAIGVVLVLTTWPDRPGDGAGRELQQIGYEVMGRSMITFLFAGFTILFAMVGGIMLAWQGGRFGLPAPASEPRDEGEGEHP